MIKKLLSVAVLAFAGLSLSAQSFSLVYPFSAATGSSGTTDPTPSPTAIGITSGSWTANGLSANPTTTNVWAFTGWPTGATNADNSNFTGSLTPTQNFEITLTPQNGYGVTITNITFYTTRSGTGPRHWAVRSNKDGYAANLPASISLISPTSSGSVITVQGGDTFFWSDDAKSSSAWYNNCMVNCTGPSFSVQTSPFIFRVHAWNAEGGAGSYRIDSAVVNGNAAIGAGIHKLTHDLNAKFQLYPNPTNDGIVMVEAKSNFSKLEVINILGAVVSTQNSLTENKIKLDLATLPEGTYFVRISSGDKVTTEKLIISK